MKEELEEIVGKALKDAAFIGYDKDDEMNQLMFNKLVEHTIKKIKKII